MIATVEDLTSLWSMWVYVAYVPCCMCIRYKLPWRRMNIKYCNPQSSIIDNNTKYLYRVRRFTWNNNNLLTVEVQLTMLSNPNPRPEHLEMASYDPSGCFHFAQIAVFIISRHLILRPVLWPSQKIKGQV